MSDYSNERQRQYRIRTNNAVIKRYEKTKNGFLMRAYRNMLSRVRGILKKKAHLYLNLPILPKQEFYDWAGQDAVFNELFAVWTVSGYDRKLSPSIDRIDPSLGYVPGNIRWLTHRENSLIATEGRWARARQQR